MFRVFPFQIRLTKHFLLAVNQRPTVLHLTPLYNLYFPAFSLSFTTFQARIYIIFHASVVNYIKKPYNKTSYMTALCIAKILKTVIKSTEAEESAVLAPNLIDKTLM